jgi:BolA protein
MINTLLAPELSGPVHALAVHAHAPGENSRRPAPAEACKH